MEDEINELLKREIDARHRFILCDGPNAHEVWAAGRIKEGWTYGPERNDKLKKHPDLIPYSELPEGEKQYDRETAMNTIKLVIKLGYDLVKR